MTSTTANRFRLGVAVALAVPFLAATAHARQPQAADGAMVNPAFTSVVPGPTAVERSTGPAMAQGETSSGMTFLERSGATGGGGQGT